ncbi:A/G-specific adenine glycosylase [Membranihabitans maritimus]|uniref:A/G-specific adenine glycosylase n=1 Tax=Membranihabitans maritimus TaxID=2904244 RepID=UPI001F020C37|nr:A/G-specific adenine glycosylase [Membranihabitans maritimus]
MEATVFIGSFYSYISRMDKWDEQKVETFSRGIMEWSKVNPRPMPWKESKDPYTIWISEIILQQTRVNQGWNYFIEFIDQFPDVNTLAAASEDEVLSAWEGLGYYSRARNLHTAANYIVNDLGGHFPVTYKDIIRLKGVGPYTAAAIASFAFNLPHGVVDGNVKRVVARVFGILDPIDDTSIKKYIQELMDCIVTTESPSLFNQAIMNFGALQCRPGIPSCNTCSLKEICYAYIEDGVKEIPVKGKKIKRKKVQMNLGIYTREDSILLIRREGTGVWKGLYSFPELLGKKSLLNKVTESKLPLLGSMEWTLSHRDIELNFYQLYSIPEYIRENKSIAMVKSEKLGKFALPRPLRLFLEENSRNLGLNEKK